jgi:hypothetical protein
LPACDSILNDIFDNPSQLAGKPLSEVKTLVGEIEFPWVEGTLSKGSHTGLGWTVREMSQSSEYTDRYLQWHPGGGRHGPNAYWKVSSGVLGTVRISSSGL